MAILTTDQSNYEDIADAIREKNGTGETYLPSEMAEAIRSIYGDVTGVKGDSENSYRTGNVNLTSANIGAKATQTPVSSPSASGTAVEFIDTISQNAQGVITPTKKAVRNATTSQSGLMSATDKGNLDNAVTDISGLKTRMTEAETGLNSAESDISDLQTRMTAAEENMSILAVCPTLEQTNGFIVQDGAIDAPLTGLTIYGKSYQDSSITPTPSSPKAIVTAGSNGTLELVSAGKNMIPLTGPETRTSYGITFTRQANGAVTFNGQNNNSSASLYVSNYFVLPAGTYILSGALSNGDLNEGDIQLLLEGNTIARSYGSTNESFTIQNTALRLQFVLRLRKGSTFTRGTFRPMIRMANVDDSKFTPRDSVFASIPTQGGLPGIPVSSGGNYTDTDEQDWLCDTIDLEAGVYIKRCGVVTFDGQSASGWERVNAANSKYRFRNTTLTSKIMKAANNDTVVPLLCTHYTRTSANATWTNNNVNGIAVDNGGGMFVADAALCDAGTLEQFLARFQTTHMTIIYPLATPEETQLTEEQLTVLRSIQSRKGLTYLYSTDQAQPEFSAEMYVDIPTYINSIINQRG